MKQVLIFPSWGTWLENRMFDDAEGCVYTNAFKLWRTRAEEHGFLLDTWDMKPVETADCVWMMDLPRRKLVFDQTRNSVRPGVPFVLQVLESPVITPQSFVDANRRYFDMVISYEPGTDERKQCFSYRLPNTILATTSGRPFGERRCAVMLNSNRVEGFLAMRQPGLEGLPGLGRHLSGWKLPLRHLFNPASGELYSWRRRLARAAEEFHPPVLDVFGRGWKGEQISWYPFYFNQPYRCAYGSLRREEKHDLVSRYRFAVGVENFRGRSGYISEKIFDVIQAGTVPIYLGEESITKYVPESVFVDASNFRNQRELLLYLRSCAETEWRQMREAGQKFLHSDEFYCFSDEAFAEQMVGNLRGLFELTSQRMLTPKLDGGLYEHTGIFSRS